VANRAKAKGTSWESAIVNWFTAHGIAARRLPLAGNKDQGDIEVLHWGLNVEAKNCRALSLAQWCAEADVETQNAGRPVVVVAKRVGKGDPGEAYVIMPLRRLYRLMASIEPGYDGPRGEEEVT
jgi:hypothetical protein